MVVNPLTDQVVPAVALVMVAFWGQGREGVDALVAGAIELGRVGAASAAAWTVGSLGPED